MSEDEEQTEKRTSWRKRLAVLALLAIVLGAAVLWSARKPIARNYIDGMLARHGVPARYDIAHFGFRSQRLENIVIGDPRSPDLTAEWAEVGFGFSGVSPSVTLLRAKGVRLRGRLVDGRLSLGALDRLMPESQGRSFALPNLYLALDDARMRLETPAGVVGMAFSGRGNLTDGFMGRLAAIADRLDAPGCRIDRPIAVLNVAITDGQPGIDGPVRASRLSCGATMIGYPQLSVDLSLSPSLGEWRGGAVFVTAGISQGDLGMRSLKGRINFNGDARNNDAHLTASADAVRLGSRLAGLTVPEGTPLSPIVPALRGAIVGAAHHLDVDASLHLASKDGHHTLQVAPLLIQSASGAVLNVDASGEGGIGWRWPEGRLLVDGKMALSGGGFPDAVLRIRRTPDGFGGKFWMEPFAVRNARVAVDDLAFDHGLFKGRVGLDGPLADGRIEGLAVPVEGRLDGRGLVVNPRCFALDFARLKIAGMRLGQTRLPVCPMHGAVYVRTVDGHGRGGATVAGPHLRGLVGKSPLLMSAQQLAVEISRPGFHADGLAIRLGDRADPTRLDVDRLTGETSASGLSGQLTGAAGKIGGVPLLLSKGTGQWALRDSVLSLKGALALDDAGNDPRFHQLVSDDVALDLKNGIVSGAATLRLPGANRPGASGIVTRVALAHDLGSGRGHALLDVPGVTFTPRFQPEMLTRLTLGVIANVSGTVAGNGRIDWNPGGVSSTGDFSTDAMNLAAAFGPVTGLAGKIHFSDLLGLQTPPGQVVTLASVNPGVSVENGVIHYQLLRDQLVRIEDGKWPFSGGLLLLDPSMLDFGKPSERHLTFRVDGMDAAEFVQQFEFKNIAVTGVFDGVLPMIFDAQGGRITGGRLVVRKAGGRLAYVGQLSNEQLGRMGNLAFDALKSVRYSNLAIELDGSLDGEIVSKILFTGTNEAPVAGRKGLVGGLTGLPFKFNITITAPFRSLVNSAQSINDPHGLVKGAIQQQRARKAPPAPVQPQ